MTLRRWPQRAVMRRWLIGLAVLWGVSKVVSPAGSGASPAPDANALVRRMMRLYQTATTIQESTEAKIVTRGEGTYIQTSTLKYKAPNRIAISTQDPHSGTVTAYADGKVVTVFSGRQNVFTRRNAKPTFAESLTTIDRATEDMMGGRVFQILNPLSILLSKETLREAKNFRFVGAEMINGRNTSRVAGQVELDWMRLVFGDPRLTPVQRDVTLWIDNSNGLLVKAALRLAWTTNIVVQGKPAKAAGGFSFEEVHRGTLLNGTLSDEEFRFSPPKGALQLFQQRK